MASGWELNGGDLSPNSNREEMRQGRNSNANEGAHSNPDQDEVPVKRPKKPKMMDRDVFVGAFRLNCQDSEEYIDGHIAPLRAAATKFYRGEPFGHEEVGRSSIVMTEVRDVVLSIMPSLLRIFTQGDSVVEFLPQSAASITQADQQTALVNHVFYHDNPGFLNLYSAFKDALIRKTGVIKLRWSDDKTVTETEFSGLLREQIVILQQDKTVQILEILEEGEVTMPGDQSPTDPDAGAPAAPQAPPQTVPTFDVRIRRTVEEKRLIMEALPPEEFLINRDARDANHPKGFTFMAQRSYKTVSEICAMGYDEDEILDNMGGGDTFQLNYEAQTRNPAVLSFMQHQDSPDLSMRQVLFIEAYMRVDKDQDGYAELRKIHAIGDAYHVLHDEVVDAAPFAVFCPDPEPHMVIGQSVADQTMDIQLIKSNMVRALLDSLAGSIHPRTVIVEGQVNMDDALNTEQGAIIRAKAVAAVQELLKPFIGQQAIPVISYMDQVKAKRTGVSDASQGLDPDVLQSTTAGAVNATVQGAQERIEMYARIFAEGPMKHLFKLAAKMLRENQDVERVLKLNGVWTPVSPKTWEMDLEAVPNVALGKGTDTERMTILQGIIAKQELIMQTLGPANPLAGLDKYRAAIVKYITLAGYKDASQFFGPITPEYMQGLQKSAQTPPPNPQMMAVQVEQQNYTQQHQLKVMEFQAKQVSDAREYARKCEADKMNALLKFMDMEGKYGGDNDPAMQNIKMLLEHSVNASESANDHVRQTQEMALNHQRQMAQMQQEQHSRMMGHAVDHAANETMANVQDAHNKVLGEAAMLKAKQKPPRPSGK
jgi:hypothetical protein